MAKLELNALMHALHGTIGNLVLVRDGDNIYVRQLPEKTPPRTESQVAHTSRFALASRWARTILADPVVKAAYKRDCHGHLTAHNIAIGDFMHAPTIESVRLDAYAGRAGDPIRLVATDDFQVTQVTVQIRSVTGEIIEQGDAALPPSVLSPRSSVLEPEMWTYTGRTELPPGTAVLVEVTALDLPGNRATAKAYHYIQSR